MSFMFNPYPFVDPEPVNRPLLPESLIREFVIGSLAAAHQLTDQFSGVLAVDGYVGAGFSALLDCIREIAGNEPAVLDVGEAYKSSDELEAMLAEVLPVDRVTDPILLFGKYRHFEIESLFDPAKIAVLKAGLAEARKRHRLVVLVGQGAAVRALREEADRIVFLDVTPMAATCRVRQRRTGCLGDERRRTLAYLFRRLYYFDYEIMMAHRQELIESGALDYYLDDNREDCLKMLPLKAFRELLEIQLAPPFRCTPVYLEGVWGGTFVKQLRRLPDDMRNCAWGFDMIPNEVSVQIKIGRDTLNIPFSTFFKAEAEKLMGRESVSRFGRIFPIRFNYDDTYRGSGNMSIQVHPPREYNNRNFGESFQQDESYYCVKTAGSKTYLGLRDDCDTEAFFHCIDEAEKHGVAFDHDDFVNSFPSEEGDQFLLPAGTIHASGRNQVVLEIGSYTIGSYTFKLYDYLRRDLDGNPRPIHSVHGKNVLVTDRRRSKIDGVLRPRPRTVRAGEGWKEEIVGEHELMYFSLRRFVFTHGVSDDTRGEKFHVLVLVDGDEILVYSRKNPENCYHANYMDMIVVPASMGEYGILNLGKKPCHVTKTMLK